MSDIPADLRYAESHEWARLEANGTVTVGISGHAQEALGDVAAIELKKVGQVLATGAQVGTIESLKAASDIYTPIAGEIIAVNKELLDNPDLVNGAPYSYWVSVRRCPLARPEKLWYPSFGRACETE